MKIGVVFPQTEIGADPAVAAKFATTAESLGYTICSPMTMYWERTRLVGQTGRARTR